LEKKKKQPRKVQGGERKSIDIGQVKQTKRFLGSTKKITDKNKKISNEGMRHRQREPSDLLTG